MGRPWWTLILFGPARLSLKRSSLARQHAHLEADLLSGGAVAAAATPASRASSPSADRRRSEAAGRLPHRRHAPRRPHRRRSPSSSSKATRPAKPRLRTVETASAEAAWRGAGVGGFGIVGRLSETCQEWSLPRCNVFSRNDFTLPRRPNLERPGGASYFSS